jgi:hypothetical protein
MIFAGGPFKSDFGLGGAVRELERVFLLLVPVSRRPFRPDLYASLTPINSRSLRPTDYRFATICSGRDDRIVKVLNIPTQAKTGLEWATRRCWCRRDQRPGHPPPRRKAGYFSALGLELSLDKVEKQKQNAV